MPTLVVGMLRNRRRSDMPPGHVGMAPNTREFDRTDHTQSPNSQLILNLSRLRGESPLIFVVGIGGANSAGLLERFVLGKPFAAEVDRLVRRAATIPCQPDCCQ